MEEREKKLKLEAAIRLANNTLGGKIENPLFKDYAPLERSQAAIIYNFFRFHPIFIHGAKRLEDAPEAKGQYAFQVGDELIIITLGYGDNELKPDSSDAVNAAARAIVFDYMKSLQTDDYKGIQSIRFILVHGGGVNTEIFPSSVFMKAMATRQFL